MIGRHKFVGLMRKGPDIKASRAGRNWIIEVKGAGTRPQMQLNFFLYLLGEIIQRITNRDDKYSIVLPNLPRYRRLWSKLSTEVKNRLAITILFVNMRGKVSELN